MFCKFYKMGVRNEGREVSRKVGRDVGRLANLHVKLPFPSSWRTSLPKFSSRTSAHIQSRILRP